MAGVQKGAARRVGAENSATRTLILDATEQVITEEGYAAASTRRVAARAGLKPSLVHYYFPTTDDLLVAVFRRAAEGSLVELRRALAASDPLQALWSYTVDASRNALAAEFVAMANHRKALKAEIAEHGELIRQLQIGMFERILEGRGASVSPLVLSVLLPGLGRAIVLEEQLGISGGHAEAKAWFEDWLRQLTGS